MGVLLTAAAIAASIGVGAWSERRCPSVPALLMLQHAGIEIAPAEVDRAVLLFELLGFERVEPPPALADGYTWVEREGTQIHLMHEDDPVVPRRGHVAVHVPDFEAALERLREHGFEPERHREHWGAPRSVVVLGGGQRVEMMAAAPGVR